MLSTRPLRLLGSIPAKRYPVGLGISPDGTRLYVTSQGRRGSGGQALGIYRLCSRVGLAGLWAGKQAKRLAKAGSKDAGSGRGDAGGREVRNPRPLPAAAPAQAQAPAPQDAKLPGAATHGQRQDSSLERNQDRDQGSIVPQNAGMVTGKVVWPDDPRHPCNLTVRGRISQ